MEYKFYGADSPTVKPIKKEFYQIKDQRHLYELLSDLWNKETCAPRMRDEWSKDNPTRGQCSITAFIVQDVFGGEVYGIPLKEGGVHCFNRIGEVEFDLTSEQFGDTVLDYKNASIQSKEKHFSDIEKYHRFLLLENALLHKLIEMD